MASRMTNTQDLCYYKLLHFLGKCLAILPNFNLDNIERYASNYFYSLIILTLLCGIYIFGTYGKFQNMKALLAPSVFLTEIASDFVIVCTNVVTIIRINICKGQTVCNMLGRLVQIDQALRKIDEKLVVYPAVNFTAELSFLLIFFVVFMIYNIYIWMASVGFVIFRFFMMRDAQNFQVLIAAILLSSYATAIKNRVNIVNNMLTKLNPNVEFGPKLFTVKTSGVSKTIVCCDAETTVKQLRKVFVLLMQVLDDYNNIFGWVQLVLYVNIVITLLNPINLMLVYGIGDKQFVAGNTFDIRMVILCVIWAALPVLIATWIFSACDHCIAEMKRIPNVCNCIVQEFDPQDHGAVINELEKFAQQVVNSGPEFSAAGFFTVNYNIYFSLIGSITTYLIVLIQFR